MRRRSQVFRVVLLSATAMALPSGFARAAGLELKSVMLSSGGVAYVEYAAEADGPVSLGLDIPLDQVDDVLKSLVVFDSAGGVGGIELPGRDGTVAAFGDVPFGPAALESPIDLLNALRGVPVEVKGPAPMSGRLLHAESVREPGRGNPPGPETTRTRVTLLAAEGLRQFVLEEAEQVQVADPVLRGRIDRAVEALRRDAGNSARHLTLRGTGTGKRSVRVGYVAAAALWKASYRLVLPPAGSHDAKARLQGWAVLENATGTDWDGVRLSLQYGNPVSFHQAIYRSYFVTRPEVPVEILGHLLPGIDTRATSVDSAAAPAGPPPPSPVQAFARAAPAASVARGMPPAQMAAPAEAAASSEGAEETVFALPTPISLASGHSASVPILDRALAAHRVGLVPFSRPHPLASVKVTNDTATSLPAGVLTLYDPSASAPFAGDARLGGLPAGESRLLSFAEDLRTSVDWRIDEGTTIATLAAADGVVRYDQRVRWTARISLAAPAAEARDLLIEVPKRDGATPVPDAAVKPSEETATAWRFAVSLAAGERREVTVQTDRILHQQMSLIGDDQAVVRLLGLQGLDDRSRAALQRLAGLRTEVSARTAERERVKAQMADADRNEDRIRKNLAAVPANDTLHARLVRQLESEDARIATLAGALDQANAAVAKAEQDLASAITALKI